jgi:hypothetical protein
MPGASSAKGRLVYKLVLPAPDNRNRWLASTGPLKKPAWCCETAYAKMRFDLSLSIAAA